MLLGMESKTQEGFIQKCGNVLESLLFLTMKSCR